MSIFSTGYVPLEEFFDEKEKSKTEVKKKKKPISIAAVIAFIIILALTYLLRSLWRKLTDFIPTLL